MPQALISYHGGGVHPVLIAGAGRHQAVGRKDNRRRNIFKFRLLALPRRAEITRQVRIFPQFRISMSRQHLAVGIDVDPPTRGLFQQQRQVLQIMAGNNHKRPLPDIRADPGGNRRAKGLRIRPVQQLHTLQIDAAELHNQREPLLHAVLPVDGAQSLVKPVRHGFLLVSEIHGVVRIGGHALDSEQQRGAQGDNIRLSLPELHQPAVSSAQPPLLLNNPVPKSPDGTVVKIDVGQRGEQAVDDQAAGLLFFRKLRKTDQLIDQIVLQSGSIRLLSAHTRADAPRISSRLLALKAKHFGHGADSPFLISCPIFSAIFPALYPPQVRSVPATGASVRPLPFPSASIAQFFCLT